MSLAWELVGEINVTTATTQVDFTGLNFTSDDNLMLVSEIYNPTVSNSQYKIFANDYIVDTSYYGQFLATNATVLTAAIANRADFSFAGASAIVQNEAFIKQTTSGYLTFQSKDIRNVGLSTILQSFYHTTSNFTITSINEINIVASTAGSIGIGSNFKLYKCIGEVVADITVATATTQVDITGLNIGKDNEYMLISDISNDSLALSNYSLYANADTTATNYYQQQLTANNTTVARSRSNNALIATVVNGATYQEWDNYPNGNKLLTTYPYQCIVKGTDDNIVLISATTPLYSAEYTSTVRRIYSSGIIALQNSYLIGGVWVPQTTKTSISHYNADIYEANADIFSDNSLTSVYFSKTTDATVNPTKLLSYLNVKLTNSGYYTYQSSTTRLIGGADVALQKNYGTKIATLTSLTQLNIVASAANGIGVGSRFQLIRMK